MEKIIINKEQSPKINLTEEYYKNLFKQYKKAIASKTIDNNYKPFINELEEWVNERKKMIPTYKILLDYMNIDINNINTAEIGKGKYDSIIKKDEDTIIITPYLSPMDKKNIIHGMPQIVAYNHPKKELNEEYNIKLNKLITQNPYDDFYFIDWIDYVNKLQYDIILGVYGKTYDKDKEKNIKILKLLKEELNTTCKEELIRVNDNYYYAIATNQIKQRKKSYKK